MTSNILKNFYESKKEEISFIHIKKGAVLPLGDKTYTSDIELPVPVRIDNLIKEINNQDVYDGITVKNIIDGIIYILGINKDFKYNDEYVKILKLINENIEAFIIYNINNLQEHNVDDAVIYSKCLVNINKNEKNLFIFGSTLEKKSISCKSKGLIEDADVYIEEAKKNYEKCLEFNENFALAYYKLGFYYKSKMQYIRANLFWKKFEKIDDDSNRLDEIRNELQELQIFVDYEKGYNFVLNGEPQKGLEILLPIAEGRTGWWNLLFFIGLAYRSLDEYKIAEKYFENVIKIKPDQLDAINELGLCQMCLGEYNKAVATFTTALLINPNNTEILCNRSVAYMYSDELNKAQADINKSLRINENDDIAISIKNEIVKIRGKSNK